jgi:hypothetical protein
VATHCPSWQAPSTPSPRQSPVSAPSSPMSSWPLLQSSPYSSGMAPPAESLRFR